MLLKEMKLLMENWRGFLKEQDSATGRQVTCHEVIHRFIMADRRFQPETSIFNDLLEDQLMEEPDFESREECYLRAAVLTCNKPDALEWLELQFDRVGDTSPEDEQLQVTSDLDWTEQSLDESFLERAHNVWKEPFLDDARKFLDDGTDKHGFFTKARKEPWNLDGGEWPTIWRIEPNNNPRCVEGNQRIHALVLDYIESDEWSDKLHSIDILIGTSTRKENEEVTN